ncbi:hypothetical protein AB0J86_17435 [Micromonospora sp. NPDC049559]|uniref:hypothetical protein n=1 Tax=Micromonospora sp. NPDC049559 TaxID=3155923 RepID=UPI00343AD8F2
MTRQRSFWLDHGYDRTHAVAGTGRYARRVHDGAAEFTDAYGDIAPVTFACVAWRLATPPALSPGFVRWHPRIISATCRRNRWDGTLTAEVTLVAGWPEELRAARHWWRDRGWRDWPQRFGQWLDPTEEDLSRRPHLRASLLVEAPVPVERLPAAPDGPHDRLAEAARRAVTVLARELDELLTPVIEQLESDPARETGH